MDTKILGRHIREARHSKQLTQYQLAERVKITPNYLSMLERGTHLPKLETLIVISEALEVPVSALLSDFPMKAYDKQLQFLTTAMEGLTEEQSDTVCSVMKVLTDSLKKQNY